MKVGECALEKTPTPVIVIKCLLLLGRMSPVLSRPCAAIQLLRAVQCSLPQWNFADLSSSTLAHPHYVGGIQLNTASKHPIRDSIQLASRGWHCRRSTLSCPVRECTHILGAFWLYLQHTELCWPVLFACIIIIICVDKFSNPFNLCSTEHAADADDGRAEGRRRLQDG